MQGNQWFLHTTSKKWAWFRNLYAGAGLIPYVPDRVCPVCGVIVKKRFMQHLDTQHGSAKGRCQQCGKAFSTTDKE